MDAGRFDAIARTLARPGSRRRLLGGGIGGAAAALGTRLGLARAQGGAPLGGACAATEDCADAVSCCGGVCLGLATFLTSNEHCGGCNAACAGTCDNGICRPSGILDCPDGVVDTLTDPRNCGGCGVGCASGFCAGGGCVACPNGSTDCGGGFCTDLGSDPENCGSCGNGCSAGFECAGGVCRLLPLPTCPGLLEPCPDDPEHCCTAPDPCANCGPEDICVGGECLGPISADGAICGSGGDNGFVTRDVGATSADGRLTLGARTTTERGGAGSAKKGRVRLTLAVSEGRTPQVLIDAVADRDRGVTMTAEYGPAFAGVRNLTFRSETGKDPEIDIDNRGAATPALAVDPAFAAAAGELDTALAGDLGACFASVAEATPIPGSPVPDGESTCETCLDVCAEALGACFPPAGASCLTDPSACPGAIVACTEAYWQCADSCVAGGGC